MLTVALNLVVTKSEVHKSWLLIIHDLIEKF